jgi:hypothetical protein
MSTNSQSRNSRLWQLGVGGTTWFWQMNAASDRGNSPESHVKDQVVMAFRLIIKAKRM